jgi:hypothetical protein
VADLYLTRTLAGLIPADEEAKQAVKRWKMGETLRCSVRKPRCYRNHKHYFALLSLTYDNQDRYTNFEHFRKAVQIEAGHVDELIRLDGEIVLIPKSIAYDALDEMEFAKVFGETMTVCARILGDLDLRELEQEVMRYAA